MNGKHNQTLLFVMKKIPLILTSSVLLLSSMFSSCGESKMEIRQREVIDSLESVNFQLRMNHDDLQRYLAVIADGFDSLAIEEGELLAKDVLEGNTLNRQRIKQNLDHVQGLLERHRERIDALEQKLYNSNADASNLRTIISTLRKQLDAKEQELLKIRAELEGNKKDIAILKKRIAHLDEEQKEQAQIIEEQKQAIQHQQRQMSVGYIKIATKKELKSLGLLSGGFLKKSKVDYSQLDVTLFQEVDLDSISSFTLPKKYKVLTPVPEGCYKITPNAQGGNTFTITDPGRFWNVTKFLIIQVDK